MKKIFIIMVLLVLGACEENEETVIPEGFERLGGQGPAHFVYVHKEMVGNRIMQREAGSKICKKYEDNDYCEVYMWKDKNKVAKKLPFRGDEIPIGVFKIKNGKKDLKALR